MSAFLKVSGENRANKPNEHWKRTKLMMTDFFLSNSIPTIWVYNYLQVI